MIEGPGRLLRLRVSLSLLLEPAHQTIVLHLQFLGSPRPSLNRILDQRLTLEAWAQPGIETGVACPSWDASPGSAANNPGVTTRLLVSSTLFSISARLVRRCLPLG